MRTYGCMSFTGGKLRLKGGDGLGVAGKKKKKSKKADVDASALVLAADATTDGGKVASQRMPVNASHSCMDAPDTCPSKCSIHD